jgi:hypothetical protein
VIRFVRPLAVLDLLLFTQAVPTNDLTRVLVSAIWLGLSWALAGSLLEGARVVLP